MKTTDIIGQLQAVLPQETDLFSTTISVVSITPSGNTATVVTSAVHGLSIGNSVAISGSESPIGITSITRVSTLVTVVTTTDHDITEGFNTTVTLSGANEAEFNGTFNLNTAVNRRTFTFTVADSGPTTGTGTMLLEDPGDPIGFNGLFTVITVPTTTSFTYTLGKVLTVPADGTILTHGSLRVTGAATIERALLMYTKQSTQSDMWAFVVLDDGVVSKDRSSRNDALSSVGPGGDRRQQFIQNASVYVFVKTTTELSGRVARDLMVDVRALLLKSLIGVKFTSDLNAQDGSGMIYGGDGIEIYDGAIYVHRFEFQLLTSITNDDTVDPTLNVAFRDVNVTILTSLGNEEITADIDLDDEPLP